MTRTVSATISTATAQETTQPIYLIRMGWETEVRAATWDSNISWNSETWVASGIQISNLDANGGTMDMPNGSADPWLALVMSETPRNRTIEVYEHHTNRTVSPETSDATLIFSGYMDETSIGNTIRVSLIEGTTRKGFPPGNIDRPTYTYLLASGQRIQYGNDIVVVS